MYICGKIPTSEGRTANFMKVPKMKNQCIYCKKEGKSKNSRAQRLIKAMAQPPHITDEDIEELLKVIKEARQPTRFESPFDDSEDIEASQ